jgi:hypothetical protein
MIKILPFLLTLGLLSSCVATKAVTIPLRVGGAIISAIPVVGKTLDDVIDASANLIDKIPL